MVDWKIRKLEDKEIDNLFKWRELVAKRDKTKEYFLWEYLNGISGSVETWVADYDGKIIGQYSSQRYEAFFFGKKMMASLSFDTGTHPDFRKQGIFHILGNHFFKEEGKQNIHFSTGFPNENFWTTGKEKFGWNGICKIPLYIGNINNFNIKQTNKFDIIHIDKFDDEFKGFSDSFKDVIPIYLNRTKEYLNWRFVDKPNLKDVSYDYIKNKIYDKTGELVSYIVSKRYKNELQLVDFLIPEDKNLYNDILYNLESLCRLLIINKISLYCNKSHSFIKFLQTKGFRFINTNRVYIVRENNHYLDKDILYNEKNHYITMGDSDII